MAVKMIYTTCSSSKEAEKIATILLEERLAACANIVHKVSSLYLWRGQIEKEFEAILYIKTKASFAKRAMDRIEEIHSYSCPFIGAIPVDKINKEYDDWIKEEL